MYENQIQNDRIINVYSIYMYNYMKKKIIPTAKMQIKVSTTYFYPKDGKYPRLCKINSVKKHTKLFGAWETNTIFIKGHCLECDPSHKK